MNHLRKFTWLIALVFSLGLMGTSNVYAQVVCDVTRVPRLVRSHGVAEVTGSIVLECTEPEKTHEIAGGGW